MGRGEMACGWTPFIADWAGGEIGLGIGDWGLGIRHWGLGVGGWELKILDSGFVDSGSGFLHAGGIRQSAEIKGRGDGCKVLINEY